MLRQFIGTSKADHYQLIDETKRWRPTFPHLGGVVSLWLVSLALLLWALSLEQIDMRQMDDTGLVSVLPFSFMLALLILNAGFCLALYQQRLSLPLLVTHLVVLVFMIYGITSVVQEEPRFAIGWKLAGIMDYVMQHGSVDGRIDAFFNWPTFFILMAFLIEISGFESATGFMSWAPVFFNLLYLGPLWMIYRSSTHDLRVVALAAWFFYLANWIGQDYLAPQAFNFFLFAVILAIALTWFRGPAWPATFVVTQVRRLSKPFGRVAHGVQGWLAGDEKAVAPSTPRQRAAFIVIMVLIVMAMVSGHQLTPFATLAALCALVAFNRFSAYTIPILLAVMVATWVLYVATPYMSGHIEHVSAPVGSVSTNLDANLTERFRGSPGHIFINYMRTGMSLVVWGLAFLGGVRRFYNGHRDWAIALTAITPFPLLLLQAYGGELLLRIYLFSVPLMVFFIATLFFPSPALGRRLPSAIALFVVSFALMVGFLFTRYGNERMMYFTPQEVKAVRYLYDTAEPGSQLVALTGVLPWRFQDYRNYKYTTIPPRITRLTDIQTVIGTMADKRFEASYLIITRSQQVAGELYIGWQPEVWDEMLAALKGARTLSLIYANHDARIYVLDHPCEREQLMKFECGAPAGE